MELLELTPPEFGVAAPGVYVLDHDRASVCAGPFKTADAALDWIESLQRHADAGQHARDRRRCQAAST